MTREQLAMVRPNEALAKIQPPKVTRGYEDETQQLRADLNDERERNGFACKWLETASLVTLPCPMGAIVTCGTEDDPGTSIVGRVIGFHVLDGDRPDDPPRIDVQVQHLDDKDKLVSTYVRPQSIQSVA